MPSELPVFVELTPRQAERLEIMARAEFRRCLQVRDRLLKLGLDPALLETEELPALGEIVNAVHAARRASDERAASEAADVPVPTGTLAGLDHLIAAAST